MYSKIASYISKNILPGMELISDERKDTLQALIDYIGNNRNGEVNLTFICTHNSRRSHLAQIWAHVAAVYFGKPEIKTYSGGTEVTAFNHRAVATLTRTGFTITMEDNDDNNPVYQVKFSEENNPMTCFSKVYDDPANPTENFAAVMTCSDAEKNCPFIPGTSARISLTYQDPKEADNTPKEKERYHERSLQIATEMFYVFSQL